MPMDDVGEFKVDIAIAFPPRIWGYWWSSEVSVKEKNIGASYCTISERIGSSRPQIGDGHHLTGGPFVPFHLCVFIGSVHDDSE